MKRENMPLMTPTQEAQHALDLKVSRSELSGPEARAEYDRLVAEGYRKPPPTMAQQAIPPSSRRLTAAETRQRPQLHAKVARGRQDVEARIADLERRGTPTDADASTLAALQAQRDRFAAAEERLARDIATGHTTAAAPISLPTLGVTVSGGNVYRKGETKPLAGAHAEVVDGKQRKSGGRQLYDLVGNTIAFGPVGLLMTSGVKFRGFAVFLFADGTSWEIGLESKPSQTRALAEAARFNALAAASAPAEDAPADAPAAAQDGITAELERLAALHASGVLDHEEFKAAKARVIQGG